MTDCLFGWTYYVLPFILVCFPTSTTLIVTGDFLFKYQTSKINQDQTAQEKLVRQLMNQSGKHYDVMNSDLNRAGVHS